VESRREALVEKIWQKREKEIPRLTLTSGNIWGKEDWIATSFPGLYRKWRGFPKVFLFCSSGLSFSATFSVHVTNNSASINLNCVNFESLNFDKIFKHPKRNSLHPPNKKKIPRTESKRFPPTHFFSRSCRFQTREGNNYAWGRTGRPSAPCRKAEGNSGRPEGELRGVVGGERRASRG
jgi:hypothetical protein